MEKRTSKEILEQLSLGLRAILFENGSTLSFQLGMKKFYVQGIDQYDRLLNMILVDCLIANSEDFLKRVYITEDDCARNYVIPYELKDEFVLLQHGISSKFDGDAYLEEEFEKKFSKYMTGGDINLIELYARI